mmetsp:Transcript_28002/g.45465  ORF Transcript_28002/g.45465 Transcript_28002/m.45465 type:complete len:213 (+) Transcript_28002:213-851(+)
MPLFIRSILFVISIVSLAFAQNCVPDDFHFCVRASESLPYTWMINNAVRPQIALQRGETYFFQMVNVPTIHQFYISTSDDGGLGPSSPDHYTVGVSPRRVTMNQVLTWAVPATGTLPQLYYQCENHSDMGNQFVFLGTRASGTPSASPSSFRTTSAPPSAPPSLLPTLPPSISRTPSASPSRTIVASPTPPASRSPRAAVVLNEEVEAMLFS